jgi:sulfite reductase (NADPH) hemoprotein beta-component
LDSLVALAQSLGIAQLRATRDQNLVIPDIPADQVEDVAGRIQALGIAVPASSAESTDVVSCPGTTTCRIGITNSPGLARTVLGESLSDPTARGIAVRISGCQNACGQHHIGDFGFHGVAKKINGVSAPHYQIHIGGDGRTGAQEEMAGLSGPIIPAGQAPVALRLLRHAYAQGKRAPETVRQWADRIGKDGLDAVLTPLAAEPGGDLFLDWGDTESFKGAPTLRGECAAPFASDDLLANFADDALIRFDRFHVVERWQEAVNAAEEAVVFASRRLLHEAGELTTDEEPAETILERVRQVPEPRALALLDTALATRGTALSGGAADPYREAVATYLDLVRSLIGGADQEKDAAE